MGGRGAAAMNWDQYQEHRQQRYQKYQPKPENYNVQTRDDLPGGARHAFFENSHNRAWSIITYNVEQDRNELGLWDQHTFKQETPAIRWVSGEQVNEVYLDGMTTQDFLEETGLEFDLGKGGYVLSKRMSRALREYYVQDFFDSDEVKIHYLPENERRDKLWDGAGLVSRKMLERMTLSSLDQAIASARDPQKKQKLERKRQKLARELRTAKRVEFTVQSAKGQDKGHAIVADQLFDDDGNEVDFMLIEDTKKQVRLVNGQTWVGFNFVHGHDHMRLDIQSLIHLQEFLDIDNLADYLSSEGQLFIESLRNGTAGAIMQRIDKNETIEDVQNWHLREFIACGGDVRWFNSHIKTLANQHLKRLNESTLEKLRLPIPGGRYYVMPADVGRRAGLEINVPRGQIQIDQAYGTAWVNDEDWLCLEDSPNGAGLASIWGGADNDDALWIFPFSDYADDNKRKILAWRSPNQLGEYAVLEPTEDTPNLVLETVDGEIHYPKANSHDLPTRTDHRPEIKSIIKSDSAGGVGEGEEYSIEVMELAIERAKINAGAVGMYCNALMLHKALFGTLPEDAPAPLEDVIDGAVKTGAELAAIKVWCVNNSRKILEMGVPIPKIIQNRLSYERDLPQDTLIPPKIDSEDKHWLDWLISGVKNHIQLIEAERDELIRQARPPQPLFDAAFFEDPQITGLDTLDIGAQFNQAYAALSKRIGNEKKWSDADEKQLGKLVEQEVSQMSEEERFHRLRQFIYEEEFKRVAARRREGVLTAEDNEEAIRQADARLARYTPQGARGQLERGLKYKKRPSMKAEKKKWTDDDHERVRRRMEDFLSRYPPAFHTAILRGAMVSVHMNQPPGSDAAVWLPGVETEEGRLPGIAQKSLQALREIGLLNEIDETEDGVITYPNATIQQPTYETAGIKNAWFAWYQEHARSTGQPVPGRPQDVEKKTQKWAKQQLKEEAKTTLQETEIEIREENKQLVAYTQAGVPLGIIDTKSSPDIKKGDNVTIRGAIVRNGSLRLAIANQ